VLASTVANVLVALALASWLRVPSVFAQLQTPSVASFSVVGVTGAVLVFAALTRLHPNPVAAFRVVAAVGLVISWIPDLLVWATHAFPGTTASGVLSLMTLHLVAAGLAVLLLGQYALTSDRRGR
jgi:hypothetical protein